MSRAGRLLIAVAAALGTLALACVPAQAATPITPGATAVSLPAYTGTSTLRANLTLTGALGGLLDGLINPIVNQDLNPLIGALQSLTVNTLVNSVLGASGPNQAGTPTQQSTPAPATFPNDTLPSPCGTSYGIPCYNATAGLSPNLGPLASLSVGAINGYTQQVAATADATNPIFGRATIANVNATVLPTLSGLTNPVVSAGLFSSKANCPNDNSAPSAMESGSTIKMLGGLVTLDLANGGDIANLKVNGVAYASVSVLPAITIGNLTVQPFGPTAIKVSLSLTAASLVSALGLPASAVTALLGYATTSTVTLSVIAGPNDAVTSSTAKAWGMGIAVDLSGSIGFNLLGVVGATVAIPTGIVNGNYGNVLDLRLGYTSCSSGSNPTSTAKAIPPALI
jgi:hypothetical protein